MQNSQKPEQEKSIDRREWPWGYEETITETDECLRKELFIKKDHQTPFNHISGNEETLHIKKGQGSIHHLEKGLMEKYRKGDVISIRKGEPYSIIPLENSLLEKTIKPNPNKDKISIRDYVEL
ncbi:hypothetical protein [uncultured Methanobacterium sp.]|uniref:hypothetical protein n=1 Tax=uncultured Methanobacterium sp. TaxID=176306 RepID=UPI002AA85113|nr:hypothetical protein [uncultured Methanobacterium sp.]